MLDRHQQAVRLHQLEEDVLEDVLGVARVSHAPADEAAQPGALPLDDVGDPPVLFACHPLQARRVLHQGCRRMRGCGYCRVAKLLRRWACGGFPPPPAGEVGFGAPTVRSPVAVLMAVALGAAGTARAERLPVRVLTTAEGLPRDQLSCVHSDARGFLWFCTEEGLVRYDGHATVTFGRADGLSPPAVPSFLHARDRRYWVGAAAGLSEFGVGAADRARRFRAVPRPDGRPGGVNALAESRDGSIWVASGRGLGRLTSGATGERLDEIDVGLPREVENDAIVR